MVSEQGWLEMNVPTSLCHKDLRGVNFRKNMIPQTTDQPTQFIFMLQMSANR
jgi:hypothetical protein